MNNRFDTPPEPSKNPIARDLTIITPERAATREILDIKMPGHVHNPPEYQVLPETSESREEQIDFLGAEVARQVIARHSSIIPRRPTF